MSHKTLKKAPRKGLVTALDSTIISPLYPVIYMATSDINRTERVSHAYTHTQSAHNLTKVNIKMCAHNYMSFSVMENPAVIFMFDLAAVQNAST